MTDPQHPNSSDEGMPSPLPPNAEDRNLALIAHLSGCAGIIAGGLIGFLGPLVIYLMYKDRSSYVTGQAIEALNFQITLFLIAIGCILLFAVSCGITFPLLFVPMILQVVYGIIAALAVRDGGEYRYPFNWRILQ